MFPPAPPPGSDGGDAGRRLRQLRVLAALELADRYPGLARSVGHARSHLGSNDRTAARSLPSLGAASPQAATAAADVGRTTRLGRRTRVPGASGNLLERLLVLGRRLRSQLVRHLRSRRPPNPLSPRGR